MVVDIEVGWGVAPRPAAQASNPSICFVGWFVQGPISAPAAMRLRDWCRIREHFESLPGAQLQALPFFSHRALRNWFRTIPIVGNG